MLTWEGGSDSLDEKQNDDDPIHHRSRIEINRAAALSVRRAVGSFLSASCSAGRFSARGFSCRAPDPEPVVSARRVVPSGHRLRAQRHTRSNIGLRSARSAGTLRGAVPTGQPLTLSKRFNSSDPFYVPVLRSFYVSCSTNVKGTETRWTSALTPGLPCIARRATQGPSTHRHAESNFPSVRS